MPQWNWTTLGSPSSVGNQIPQGGLRVQSAVGVVTVKDTPTSAPQIYAFVLAGVLNQFVGSLWLKKWDGSLGSQGIWENRGTPPGVNLDPTQLGLGVVTMMDTPTAPQRYYAFVRASDGNMWVNYDPGLGHAPAWSNQGKPAGLSINLGLGAVTMMNTPTSQQRPFVFVRCNDSKMWFRWWTGSEWTWQDLGKPQGVNIQSEVGAITVQDTPTSPQRPFVFVRGSDGNLWVNYNMGPDQGWGWHWHNIGAPPGVTVVAGLGAVTMMDTPTAQQRPHVFVRGSNGHLYLAWYNSVQWSWNWQDLGTPSGLTIDHRGGGAVTVMDTSTSQQQAREFVVGSDGHLWGNFFPWQWEDHGRPVLGVNVNVSERAGQVTMMNTPTSPQRPYVFTLSTTTGGGTNTGLLFVRWLG